MAKGRFTVNPFPELVLTPDDHEELKKLANANVLDHLARYNEHVGVNKKRVDMHRWKKLVEIENVITFTEIPGTALAESYLTGSGLPMNMAIGVLPGKQEDLMLGVLNPTLEAMRIKASYVEDLSGAAVLDAVVLPTQEEPFQSLIVKWMEVDIPLSSTNLVKNRDYVYLEATGFVTTADGEHLAYHIFHSVDFPTTPSLPNRVRANLSAAAFWRQKSNNNMEMFATNIMDPGSGFIKKLAVPVMGKAFMASLKYVYCGQMKKLSWMLEKRYEEAKEHGTPNKGNTCVTCSTLIKSRRLGNFGKSNSLCKLCFGHVCHSCRIARKLSFVTPDLELEQRKVTFCAACIAEVTSSSATVAAREQMATEKPFKHGADSDLIHNLSSCDSGSHSGGTLSASADEYA